MIKVIAFFFKLLNYSEKPLKEHIMSILCYFLLQKKPFHDGKALIMGGKRDFALTIALEHTLDVGLR